MAISIEHISSTKKQCTATFTSEEFRLKYKSKFKQFKPKALIDGFRPGKIADSVVEKKFGLSIKQEALDELLQSAWTQILEDNKFEPIAQPRIDIQPNEVLKNLQFNEELIFNFSFEVNP